MSDKLKEQGQLCLDISTALFNDMGALPPNIIFFCEDKVVNLFFDDMSDNAKKYEISFTAIFAAYYLKNVESIGFNSEAWGLDISPESTPELWEQYNGDANDIRDHIMTEYGQIADCPYKHEMLMTIIDDGKIDYLMRSEIVRDGDEVTINKKDSYPNAEPKKMDFHQRFNSLLFKAQKLTEAVAMVLEEGADVFPDKNEDDAILGMTKAIKKEFNIEFNEVAAMAAAKRVVKHIGNGKTKVTLH